MRFLAAVSFFTPLFFALVACTPARPISATSDSQLTGCAALEKSQFDTDSAQQMLWYQNHGAQMPDVTNRAELYHGTNGRAVVVVQGFASSPQPLNQLIVDLNTAGYTVIAPLMTGFSSSPEVANASSVDDWRASFEQGVQLAKICNSDISVVALSLGGSIVIDDILNRGFTGISHFVGLSPLIKQNTTATIADTLLYPATTAITVADLQTLLGVNPYLFLPVSPPPPGEPAPNLPVTAMHNMFSFITAFATPPPAPSPIPTLVVVSDDDDIMLVPTALAYVTANFPNLTKVEYPESDGIGHSLEGSSVNPHYAQMLQQILTLLSGS